MRLELTGRHVRITAPLKRLVDERLQKLDRLLHDRVVSMQVVLCTDKSRPRAEMNLHARGEHFFHATGSGATFEVAVNQALERINQQARKLKSKWDDGKRQRLSAVKASAGLGRVDRSGSSGDGRRPVADSEGGSRAPRVVRVPVARPSQ